MKHGKNIKGVDEFMKLEPISFEEMGGKVIAGEEKRNEKDKGPKTPKLETAWTASQTQAKKVE